MNSIVSLISGVLLDVGPKPPPSASLVAVIPIGVIIMLVLICVPLILLGRMWASKKFNRARLGQLIVLGAAYVVIGMLLFVSLMSSEGLMSGIHHYLEVETRWLPMTDYSYLGNILSSVVSIDMIGFIFGGLLLALGSFYTMRRRLEK